MRLQPAFELGFQETHHDVQLTPCRRISAHAFAMNISSLLLLAASALPALGDTHHFCWCESAEAKGVDICLTQAACDRYPREKFFNVQGGDPNAPAITKMNPKLQKCYSTRAWPIIPHPYLGGDEFEEACFAAARDPRVINACVLSQGGARSHVKSRCTRNHAW
ncbi:hypothetical protein LZ31DRAFT_541544 [Colletotrichum somersetense]|nr:hypothetical protein LZ31DRAFT_541544 [Colletotrichum somersetense]